MKFYYVYILCNKRNGTLYIGMTSDLKKRIYEHRNKLVDGFTKEYNLTRLVWYEQHDNAQSAVTRERQVKHWNRAWRLELIDKSNPLWEDLYESL